MSNEVYFNPKINLIEKFPETIKLILQKDSTWLAKLNQEKWEVVNLVRKDLYMKPIDMNTSIVTTLKEMEDQILYLRILSRTTTSRRQKHG
jgi:hypothetical protein